MGHRMGSQEERYREGIAAFGLATVRLARASDQFLVHSIEIVVSVIVQSIPDRLSILQAVRSHDLHV